jgi:hypothetical protein
MFSGSQSHQGKSQSLVTWVASVEETKRMKPTDKAIFRMVSESPGRNASELVMASTKNKPRRPSSLVSSEGNMLRRRLTDTAQHSGGVVRDSTVTRTCRATGEAVLVPSRNRWSKHDRITGETGKSIEGETVAARSVVAKKWGNAHRAKRPCCT